MIALMSIGAEDFSPDYLVFAEKIKSFWKCSVVINALELVLERFFPLETMISASLLSVGWKYVNDRPSNDHLKYTPSSLYAKTI